MNRESRQRDWEERKKRRGMRERERDRVFYLPDERFAKHGLYFTESRHDFSLFSWGVTRAVDSENDNNTTIRVLQDSTDCTARTQPPPPFSIRRYLLVFLSLGSRLLPPLFLGGTWHSRAIRQNRRSSIGSSIGPSPIYNIRLTRHRAFGCRPTLRKPASC